jgi:hyperosmotically inducible protein
VAVAATLIAGPTRTAARQSTTADRDVTLTQQIQTTIAADPSLKPYGVDVRVEHGVATLAGTVQTDAQRTRAGRLARVKGVTRVDNELVVDKSASADLKSQLKETGQAAGETAKTASGIAAEKTRDALSKTGEVMSDTWVTTKVRTRMAGDSMLKGSDVKVSTENHVVTLTGTVASASMRAHLIDLVKTTEGVVDVVDEMSVR